MAAVTENRNFFVYWCFITRQNEIKLCPPNEVWETYYVYSVSYYSSSSSFFLSSVKSLSDTFLGDALIKLYETLYEYHMPCEVDGQGVLVVEWCLSLYIWSYFHPYWVWQSSRHSSSVHRWQTLLFCCRALHRRDLIDSHWVLVSTDSPGLEVCTTESVSAYKARGPNCSK